MSDRFYNYIKNNLNKLTKEQLFVYVPELKKTVTKNTIIDAINEGLSNGQIDLNNIYKDDEKVFAIQSQRLPELLKINGGFLDWVKKNKKIDIIETETVYAYGKYINVPYWSAKVVFELIEDKNKLEELKQEFEAHKNQKKKEELSKRKTTKATNDNLRREFDQQHKQLLQEWKQYDEIGAMYLELSFWTMWVSRWAKVYQEKYRKNSNHADMIKSQDYYKLKEEALKLLSESQYAGVTIYHPENPDKLRINLCEHHYQQYKDWYGWKINIKEFYEAYKDKIDDCEMCMISHEENYYSLFHIRVSVPEIKESFSFHIPYQIGEQILGHQKYEIEQGVKENREGLFRFGRPLFELEKIIITESRVKKGFNTAINHLKTIQN